MTMWSVLINHSGRWFPIMTNWPTSWHWFKAMATLFCWSQRVSLLSSSICESSCEDLNIRFQIMLGIDQLCLTTPMIDRDIPMTISSVGFLFFPSSTNRFPVPTSAKLQRLSTISPQISNDLEDILNGERWWSNGISWWLNGHFPNSSGQIPILSIVTHKESPLFMVFPPLSMLKFQGIATKRREVNSHPQPMLGLTQGWMPGHRRSRKSHFKHAAVSSDDPQWTLSVNVKCTVKVNCLLISINVYQYLSMSINIYQCLSMSINVYQCLSIWKMIFYRAVCSDHSQFTTL